MSVLNKATKWSWRPTALYRNRAIVAALGGDGAWQTVDREVRGVVENALLECQPWTQVPFLNAMSFQGNQALNRAYQIATWAILHVPSLKGKLSVPSEIVVWTPATCRTFPAGQYDITYLREVIGPAPRFLALDRHEQSVMSDGDTNQGRSRNMDELADDQRKIDDSMIMDRLVEFQAVLPNCASWVYGAVRILVPWGAKSNFLRSASDPQFPGIVWVQTRNRDFLLEGLIHEAAHHYFDRADMEAELTFDTPTAYSSPLRPEPRTLRSVLVAYHALAYIAAFYREAMDVKLVNVDRAKMELIDTIERLQHGARSIDVGSSSLTPAGRKFLHETNNIWSYVSTIGG
jgi:hypothetical protein